MWFDPNSAQHIITFEIARKLLCHNAFSPKGFFANPPLELSVFYDSRANGFEYEWHCLKYATVIAATNNRVNSYVFVAMAHAASSLAPVVMLIFANLKNTPQRHRSKSLFWLKSIQCFFKQWEIDQWCSVICELNLFLDFSLDVV